VVDRRRQVQRHRAKHRDGDEPWLDEQQGGQHGHAVDRHLHFAGPPAAPLLR
jgi:hypothetical protein